MVPRRVSVLLSGPNHRLLHPPPPPSPLIYFSSSLCYPSPLRSSPSSSNGAAGESTIQSRGGPPRSRASFWEWTARLWPPWASPRTVPCFPVGIQRLFLTTGTRPNSESDLKPKNIICAMMELLNLSLDLSCFAVGSPLLESKATTIAVDERERGLHHRAVTPDSNHYRRPPPSAVNTIQPHSPRGMLCCTVFVYLFTYTLWNKDDLYAIRGRTVLSLELTPT
ncbi:PREDICTED: uncharacterized protein LOC109155165 [Ipomoea nil]|uniref:uncharacterized protein LOC109155165 n=1 Tax=Ipomoea nil TaxID=35883 RepID=UPI0009012A1A|nr:PREDICTED: uncharacterized protein LOC109155165 [Ipomoea nil]